MPVGRCTTFAKPSSPTIARSVGPIEGTDPSVLARFSDDVVEIDELLARCRKQMFVMRARSLSLSKGRVSSLRHRAAVAS